ncbi:MAG TPA: multicopper oxidase domain-containing protein [Bacteroidia bacterium]|nr:multicopper oxidase domain-containing protein [Bacteroidia bacterium]
MKRKLYLFFLLIVRSLSAQNPIPIPDTLTGTTFQLTLHPDSVAFLPGVKTFTNAFNNNSYLGPTLLLNKGDFVTLNVENILSDTSTVHWHGLHVPAMADGGPHTVILPNTTWQAQFEVKNNASTYWYHPHMHMRTGEQAMRGAAGMIIIRDTTEARLNIPRRYGVDDFPLIIQTQQFDSSNQILWRGMNDSIILVNGTQNPQVTLPDQVVRLRLLNAEQSRTFNFGFTGNIPFSIIASDGGLLEAPLTATRLRLSPGERAEVLLNLRPYPGQTFYLMSYGSELPMGVQGGPMLAGMDSAMFGPLDGIDFNILQIDVGAPTVSPIVTIPASLVTINRLQENQSEEMRWITITPLNSTAFMGPFYFNGLSFDMMRVDYTIPLGHTEIWNISNQSMVSHPFHMHDVQFFILDRDGVPPPAEEMGFKDDFLLFPNETVRIIMKFEDYADPMIPYMYHCHILMHEDDGMMGQFIVSNGAGQEEIAGNFNSLIGVNPVQCGILSLHGINNTCAEKCLFRIYNSLGENVFSSTEFNLHYNQTLNISFLPPGMYFVEAENSAIHQCEKFLKLN